MYGAVQIFLSFLYQITHLALSKSLVATSPNVGLDSSKMNAISQLLNKVDIELLEELKKLKRKQTELSIFFPTFEILLQLFSNVCNYFKTLLTFFRNSFAILPQFISNPFQIPLQFVCTKKTHMMLQKHNTHDVAIILHNFVQLLENVIASIYRGFTRNSFLFLNNFLVFLLLSFKILK